ncbi:MAG: RDD family protein [Gemmatimonadota bacterium]|jgi:uncharacterized RDD family membrane protein YckC
MPTHAAPPRDPRTIITPDAFELSEELLGLPLAPPMKRFWAILIDLAVIGLITLLTKSFAMVLGVVAAVFFIRASFKRTEVPNSAFGRAMRLSLGCLGLFIGLVTAIVWVAVGGNLFHRMTGGDNEARVTEAMEETGISSGRNVGLTDVFAGMGEAQAFRRAESRADAVAAATNLARHGRDLGMSSSEIRDFLTDLAPTTAAWAENLEQVLDQALAASSEEVARDTVEEEEATARQTLLDSVAADTLHTLTEHIASLERDVVRGQQEARSLRAALQDAESGGLFSWLRNFVDELGFGFGWGSLYLTVMLSWWKGQTVGKRLMGIRVLRLDGDAITWWTAFERAGGYAAGFATGLLGFAQVFWDANRQAIHDRIVGTVVVLEGAPRVEDWEKAL